MAKNISEIPYTEIVERTAQIARLSDENDRSRVRGAVQDGYVRELPYKEDWQFWLASSALTTTQQYDTGTVSINTQQTTATFSSDVTLDATFTGRKIKFSGNANVYDLTFSATTAATISPPLSGTTNVTQGAYTIFAPIYPLAPDFQRFPKNGGLQIWAGGQMTIAGEKVNQNYYRDYTSSPSTPDRCRLLSPDTAGNVRVELQPPPTDPMVIPYEYLRQVRPMQDTTAGFASITAGATTVTGSAGTTNFAAASTGWYMRVDAFGIGADSTWHRIVAIANDSSMTISPAFGTSGVTLTKITLSSVPECPALLHPFIMWNAAKQIMADQNDPTLTLMSSQQTANLQDAKRLYKTRIYNQEIETIAEDWQYRR